MEKFNDMEQTTDISKVGTARAEYIEVEPNVRLHVTDAGEGRPIVLIHGWPLSDEMFEYQYNALIKNNFRAKRLRKLGSSTYLDRVMESI